MLIPITRADFDNGRIRAMTQCLQITLPALCSETEAMHALARILGYADVKALNAFAGPLNEASQCSRDAVFKYVSWRLWRGSTIDFITARQIAKALNLRSLEVDSYTFEAAQERHTQLQEAEGRFIVMDEFWRDTKEHAKTSAFLVAGAPAYRVAVLADKTICQWSTLEDLWDSLPSSFVQDLAQEPLYAGYANDDAREVAFIQQELLPLSCTPLSPTIKEIKLLPHGFSIVWLFTDGGDSIGDCIGRVLYNNSLGGIIPKLYSKDTDELFDDASLLLCGDTIQVSVAPFTTASLPVYVKRFGGEGYNFANDTKPAYSEARVTAKDMELLSLNIGCSIHEGHLQLCGSVFIEEGQTYIRRQDHFMIDVPASIGEPLNAQVFESVATIPADEHTRFLLAQQYQTETFGSGYTRMQSPENIRSLTNVILRLLRWSDLNTYCQTLIDEDMPVDEHEAFDSNSSTEKRCELELITRYGQDIKHVFPALSSLEETTLGYILLLRHGTYLGARNNGWFQAPSNHDMQEQLYYLLTLLFHVVGCNMKTHIASVTPNFGALVTIADLMLDGLAEVTSFFAEYDSIDLFCKRLTARQEFENSVTKWRNRESNLNDLRVQGQYLYVKSPIELKITTNVVGSGKSTLLYGLMNARKHSTQLIQVTQFLEDFTSTP